MLKCTGAPDSQSGVLSILCFTVQYDDFLQEKPICVIGKWGSLVSQLETLSRCSGQKLNHQEKKPELRALYTVTGPKKARHGVSLSNEL